MGLIFSFRYICESHAAVNGFRIQNLKIFYDEGGELRRKQIYFDR